MTSGHRPAQQKAARGRQYAKPWLWHQPRIGLLGADARQGGGWASRAETREIWWTRGSVDSGQWTVDGGRWRGAREKGTRGSSHHGRWRGPLGLTGYPGIFFVSPGDREGRETACDGGTDLGHSWRRDGRGEGKRGRELHSEHHHNHQRTRRRPGQHYRHAAAPRLPASPPWNIGRRPGCYIVGEMLACALCLSILFGTVGFILASTIQVSARNTPYLVCLYTQPQEPTYSVAIIQSYIYRENSCSLLTNPPSTCAMPFREPTQYVPRILAYKSVSKKL